MENQKKSGFTLVEMLIVIAIIGILFIVLISKVDASAQKAKVAGVQCDFRSFYIALDNTVRESSLDTLKSKRTFIRELNKNLDSQLEFYSLSNEGVAYSAAKDPWGGHYMLAYKATDSAIQVMVSSNAGGNTNLKQHYDIANFTHAESGQPIITMGAYITATGIQPIEDSEITNLENVVANAEQVTSENESELLATDEELADWDFTLNGATHEITLLNYKGESNSVLVKSVYTIKGTAYGTVINSHLSAEGKRQIRQINDPAALSLNPEAVAAYASLPFYSCSNRLQSVTFEDGVIFKDCFGLFANCTALTSVNFGNPTFSAMGDMSCMFANCISLTSLDLSSFKTKYVSDMSYMFFNCRNLADVNMTGLDWSKVVYMNSMFCQATAMSPDLSQFNAPSAKDVSYMFFRAIKFSTIDVSFLKNAKLEKIIHMFDISGKYTEEEKGYHEGTLSTITGYQNLDVSNVTDFSYVFADTNKVKHELDLSKWKVSNATTMEGMFSFSSVQSYKLTGWNTAKVTNFASIFRGCKDANLNVSVLNTSNATTIAGMFQDSSFLTSIDISKLDLSNVTDAQNLFTNCAKLTSVNLGHNTLENCKNVTCMFSGCTALTSVDLQYLKTAKWEAMSHMFESSGIYSLDMSTFDFGNIRSDSVYKIFNGMPNLTTIKTPVNMTAWAVFEYAMTDADGNVYNGLPSKLSKSITLTKTATKVDAKATQ